MSNIILPDDPNFNVPVVMGDPFTADPDRDLYKQGITPGTIKKELDKKRSPGEFKYAETMVAHAPDPWFKMLKMSQATSTGVDNMMTNPMWFSPLHTPQNWQIASKRREVYQWNRFWYENEPKVAAAIDFYARFPMNGFILECPDPKILSFFKHHIVDKLKLNERFKEISSEYYMLGDVFIHTDIECEVCGGTGVDPDTKDVCDHAGGMFKRIFVMNPDWIEVQKSPLTDDPLIVLIPDEELQQIVHKRSPKPIYDRIPEHLKPMILAKAPIPLSNRTISHLKHMNVPYGTYGTSIIRRLFTTLAYKTKIMTANWIVAERLILPVRVVKIGSDDRPASTTDIADVQQQLAQVANDPNLTIVTHHNFEYDWYGTSGKVLQITQEMEHIDKELLDGLMLNQALLNGEMSGYQSAQVGVETLIRRIESWRQTLSEWCEERIFKPIAEMQGFVDEEKSEEVGETVFLHPTIKWNDLELKDKTQYHQMLMQLHDKQVISTQTLLEEIGLNYDQEVKRMRYEQAQMGPMGAQMGQGMGAMGGGGGMGGMPGGAASPEQGGMGGGMGMGGDMAGGMGMGMGGGMDMGGGGMAGGAAAAEGGGKITKKGKGNKQSEEEVAIPMMPIKLTKIEQKMASMLERVADTVGFPVQEVRMQFPVENPTGGKAYSMDFAIPALKIDIEADGEVWHSSNEQVGDDQERDYMLAQRGWTVLRFDDKSIEEATQQVEATINSHIQKAMQATSGGKQASVQGNNIQYYTGTFRGLKDFHDDGAKYYRYLERLYPSRIKMHREEILQ